MRFARKIKYNFIFFSSSKLLPNSVEQWVYIKYYLLDTHLKSLYLYHWLAYQCIFNLFGTLYVINEHSDNTNFVTGHCLKDIQIITAKHNIKRHLASCIYIMFYILREYFASKSNDDRRTSSVEFQEYSGFRRLSA